MLNIHIKIEWDFARVRNVDVRGVLPLFLLWIFNYLYDIPLRVLRVAHVVVNHFYLDAVVNLTRFIAFNPFGLAKSIEWRGIFCDETPVDGVEYVSITKYTKSRHSLQILEYIKTTNLILSARRFAKWFEILKVEELLAPVGEICIEFHDRIIKICNTVTARTGSSLNTLSIAIRPRNLKAINKWIHGLIWISIYLFAK